MKERLDRYPTFWFPTIPFLYSIHRSRHLLTSLNVTPLLFDARDPTFIATLSTHRRTHPFLYCQNHEIDGGDFAKHAYRRSGVVLTGHHPFAITIIFYLHFTQSSIIEPTTPSLLDTERKCLLYSKRNARPRLQNNNIRLSRPRLSRFSLPEIYAVGDTWSRSPIASHLSQMIWIKCLTPRKTDALGYRWRAWVIDG